MKKQTEYVITKWKIDGSLFGFSDEGKAREKFKEMKGLLKSNEKLSVSQTDSEIIELDW